MSCGAPGPSLDLCPSEDEITPQLLALLPRGRAWGTHDGGPFPGSTLYQFWAAVAAIWAWVNTRICDLRREFFCATQSETHDWWMEEYGLPDGCDPFPDLCTKVAAIGGTRCEYYTAIAARAGWAIECTDVNSACGVKAGAALAGCATTGRGLGPAILLIRVHLSQSPAYVGGAPTAPVVPVTPAPVTPSFAGLTPPLAGRAEAGGFLLCFQGGLGATALSDPPLAGLFQAGETLGCPGGAPLTPPLAGAAFAGGILSCLPDLTGLECLLARIVGAHVLIIYEAVS